MAEQKFNQPYYKIHFAELDDDIMGVVSFEGEEEISGLFEFRIQLASLDPNIDSVKILNKPATLTLIRPDQSTREIHGLISNFEQTGKSRDYIFYRVVLVPRLWQLNLIFQNEIYQNLEMKGLISKVLEGCKLSGGDLKVDLKNTPPKIEFMVQYRETSLNFLNRRLEHFGIYYYFDQSSGEDVVCFIDDNSKCPVIESSGKIGFNENREPLGTEESIFEIICHEKVVTGSVQLKDYNYMFPEKQLMAQSQIDSRYPGTFYDYGEHFENEKEAGILAKIRNQEILCQSKIFYGNSDCRLLSAGYKFSMEKHYRDDWNGDYIVTSVMHKGNQHNLFSFQHSATKDKPYENNFTAIPSKIDFRPARRAYLPKISGIINAKVDASGDGQYASIDKYGRYKVKIPFDLSDRQNGEASLYIRMAQPYAGASYGMHFPLHKGTEVLLTFVDGDPDRPIIANAVPNAETTSPVTGANQTKNIIHTGGGNRIELEDTDGNQQIAITSPTKSSKISIGAPNEGNIFIKTIGDMVTKVDGPLTHVNKGDTYYRHGARYKYECDGEAEITFKDNVHERTVGNVTEEFLGTKTSKVIGNTAEEFYGIKTSKNLAATLEDFIGAKVAHSLATTYEFFAGVKRDVCMAFTVSYAAGASIEKSDVKILNEAPINEIKGEAGVKITCGSSSIEMTPGSIKIKSPSVLISSSGGMVRMNGDVTIGGRTAFTDNVAMDEKLRVNGQFSNPSMEGTQ